MAMNARNRRCGRFGPVKEAYESETNFGDHYRHQDRSRFGGFDRDFGPAS